MHLGLMLNIREGAIYVITRDVEITINKETHWGAFMKECTGLGCCAIVISVFRDKSTMTKISTGTSHTLLEVTSMKLLLFASCETSHCVMLMLRTLRMILYHTANLLVPLQEGCNYVPHCNLLG